MRLGWINPFAVRILHRQRLLCARPRKRPKKSYLRRERPAPTQLWQMDIVGGLRLVNPATGGVREAKVITAVDDHSRFSVIAKVRRAVRAAAPLRAHPSVAVACPDWCGACAEGA